MSSLFLFVSCQQPLKTEEKSNGEPQGPHTSVEWRVWAYSTAAPSFIAENATVLSVDGKVLREGTNGWSCMAANPRGISDPENGWKDPHEAMPMCGDAESMKWVMAFMSGEKPELDICALEDAMHIPMMSIPRMLSELDKNTPIVAMCHTGVRSSQACLYLMQHGYDVVNLQGGIDAWAKEIDPRLKQY